MGNSHNKGGKNRINNTGQKKADEGRQNYNDKYVGAPYNFVSQWETVVEKSSEDCVAHNVLNDELISGEISYRLTAETEIVVAGGNNNKFYKNPYGNYALPGSTIRGLIRNNVQILGLSSIADDVEDYALMFREVGGGKNNPNKKIYGDILGSKSVIVNNKSVSVLKNVKAGYIVKEGKDYKIYRTKVDKINDELGKMNYYIVNERFVQEKDKTHAKYPFFWNNPEHMQHDLSKLFIKNIDKKNRVHYKGEINKTYKPYYSSVRYCIKGARNVVYVGDADSNKGIEGTIIGTGKMNEKKCHYIIPQIDREKTPINLKTSDINAFKIDYKHKKNNLGENASFFDLPKEKEVKPVFYIETKRHVYFGFTPRLRLFYKHTIKDGLSDSQKTAKLDYAKILFGYSGKDDSYKTRVSFSDAVIVSDENEGCESQVILGEPSPSSYNDYIMPTKKNEAVTFNEDSFRIRGVKQYWLRNSVVSCEIGNNKNVAVSLHPLSKGTVFEGKVRFHNLKKSELGLLVWSIKLNNTSRLQIGKAKPFGYGRVKPEIISIKELNAKEAYSEETFSLNPFIEIEGEELSNYITDLISIYKSEMNDILKKLGIGNNLDELTFIKEFFAMKDSENLPGSESIRYMNINNGEYQNRRPLPSALEVKESK